MAAITGPDPRFWDRIAPRYAKKPVRDEVAYHATLDRVRHYLRPSDRALEIGCGTGTTALLLAGSVAELQASDVSPGMVRIAEDKARAGGVQNVRFAVGTLDEPLHAAESFDAIMAFNLFHLLEDIPGALERVWSLLAPGGHLLFKTPCLAEQGRILRVLIPVLRAVGRAPFVNFVTEKSLLDDVNRAGFEILETGLYPKKSHSLFIAARKPK